MNLEDEIIQAIPASAIKEMSQFLLGKETFHKALELITILDTQDLPKETKKKAVMDDLEYIVRGLGKALLSIGIDLAVAWLRAASKEAQA
jgi:hypothetical protein